MSSKGWAFNGTVRSNLTLGMENPVSDQELWQALEIAQAKDFVSEKDGRLDAEVQLGGRISPGGQKQRFIDCPSIYVNSLSHLDDATSAMIPCRSGH